MENRILIIGDELLGEQGEAANRFAEILLCRDANRPIQFSINAPAPQTLQQLYDRASADIIGKKAGRIIVGLGLKELKRGGKDYNGVFAAYEKLADEILSKTLASIHFLTVPEDMFPVAPSQLTALNDCIRGLQQKDEKRVKILDFAAYVADFKEKQLERGKFGRSLYTEDGSPTSICNTFMALFLYDCIKKELK
ncbi:hypothetical protein SAMN05720487_10198 [Fibrobacter sp. UWT2]|jgi:hypothetical protein|uniref:hypothetical protein n=1 Tax=Fibrobacter sp. UWT2 TaxID=1896224 RepID=UPI000918F6BC|nr:hypothetical protein [Fibrobacter sp. UWT2]SHK35762.1 hypothetical protein SAMN05720487_10198 [Fibrobacter sp. UWT2]